MSTTLDTFSTPHMIDHEFKDYEFPSNSVLFQLAENEINNTPFEFDAEEPCFSSDEDELSVNHEIELEMVPSSNDNEETINNLENENNQLLSTPVPQTPSSLNDENNHGEYTTEETSKQEDNEIDQTIEATNEEENDDSENSITPILLTYCSKKYCIFTDAINPDTPTQLSSQLSPEHVIFSNEPELYSQSLKSFMQSIQSHFKIINDIVIFFPTLKLKFYSHIPFAEKLSLRDIAFLASNVNPQSNILEIELTEEPYNFVSQYQLLINITREELSDEENLPVEQVQDEEELSEQSNLGKRQRQDNTENDGQENQAKRQKL